MKERDFNATDYGFLPLRIMVGAAVNMLEVCINFTDNRKFNMRCLKIWNNYDNVQQVLCLLVYIFMFQNRFYTIRIIKNIIHCCYRRIFILNITFLHFIALTLTRYFSENIEISQYLKNKIIFKK